MLMHNSMGKAAAEICHKVVINVAAHAIGDAARRAMADYQQSQNHGRVTKANPEMWKKVWTTAVDADSEAFQETVIRVTTILELCSGEKSASLNDVFIAANVVQGEPDLAGLEVDDEDVDLFYERRHIDAELIFDLWQLGALYDQQYISTLKRTSRAS